MNNLPHNPERQFGFALPDSETSPYPVAGTIIDQIIALQEAGEVDLAKNLMTQERQRLTEELDTETSTIRQVSKKQPE